MGHEAEHIFLRSPVNARDVVAGSVWIGRSVHLAIAQTITEGDLVVILERLQHSNARLEATFRMSDRELDDGGQPGGERPGRGGRDVHIAALKTKVLVARKCARQQADLGQDLEAIADSEHEPALIRMGAKGRHNGTSAAKRAAAKVIAVREPTGKRHQVNVRRQPRLLVPHDIRGDLENVAEGVHHFSIGIGPRKNDNSSAHK